MNMREVAFGPGNLIYVWATPDAMLGIMKIDGVAGMEPDPVRSRYCLLLDPRYEPIVVMAKILEANQAEIMVDE